MPETPNQPKSVRPVALVTGAGSGIGRAAAILLGEHGHDLALVGRTASTLGSTATLCRQKGARAEAIVADVSDPREARRMVEEAALRFGRLDALVNNAGTAPLRPIEETTADQAEAVFAVNAIGPALAIAAAWPHLVRSGRGCVVNLSTMGTADPFPGFFLYAAAKSAVNSFARSIAKEGAPHNIRAFAIAPGAVETQMLRGLFPVETLPPEKCLSPEQIAAVILECVRGARDHENGATIFIPSPA